MRTVNLTISLGKWPARTWNKPKPHLRRWKRQCESPERPSSDSVERTAVHSASGDCKKLSSLGHFLKGSSATLGVTKVQNSCESIQHYGDLRDNKTAKNLAPDVALSKISAVLKEAKEEYKEAEIWLRKWYSEAKAQGRITEDDDDD